MSRNDTMMQYFEWYLPGDSTLWDKVSKEAVKLANMGITSIWLPPAYKGAAGTNDTGYGVYDLYDLGEFDQKGTIPTKYGTKEEYLNAIEVLKENNIKVYADIVLNHKMGADELEEVLAVEDDPQDRTKAKTEERKIKAWTKYNFPGRGDTYSSFKWNWTCFHGVDWDDIEKKTAIYRFYGKSWNDNVDKEYGNFDYLMGADIDMNNHDVVQELKKWGKWYIDVTNVDGFRLDAVKHIRADFYPEWLEEVREYAQKDLLAVGEYWTTDINTLNNYIKETGECMRLFDVPLHYNMYRAAYSNGEYDMSQIFDGTLVKERPDLAVTFVDNHDTEPGQGLESWIPDWFKPHAYALTLLRKDGLPCIFYGDFYGIEDKSVTPKNEMLHLMLKVRKYFAYGEQEDYFNGPDVIGFCRKGSDENANSGLVVVMSDSIGGGISMNLGPKLGDSIFYDCTGNLEETVYVDHEGNGIFYCKDGSVSVWIKKTEYVN